MTIKARMERVTKITFFCKSSYLVDPNVVIGHILVLMGVRICVIECYLFIRISKARGLLHVLFESLLHRLDSFSSRSRKY